MYNRILVTGGCGFVGSSLALDLKRRFPSTAVLALDNLRRRGSELNLVRLRQADVEFVHGDVRNSDDLLAAGKDSELIIECSAEPSAQAGYGGSAKYLIDTNLTGCFHCLECARDVGAHFLFLSTSRVYPVRLLNELHFYEDTARFHISAAQTVAGVSEKGINEEFSTAGARSLYGMTKLAAELMITEYSDAYGVRSIINRCGLIAGPWQMGKLDQGVIALWLAAHYFRKPLEYIGFGGSGKQVRDVLHVADLCDLVALQLQDFGRFAGGIYNVGGGAANSVSLLELTRLSGELTGNTIPIRPNPEQRRADIRIYLTDHSYLTRLSGWEPKRDPKTTLQDILLWIQREENLVRPILGGNN